MRPPCNNYHFPLKRSTIACLYGWSFENDRNFANTEQHLWSGIIYRIFSVWNTSLAKRKTITTIMWPWKYVKWIDSLDTVGGKCNLLFWFSQIKNCSGSCKRKLFSAELSFYERKKSWYHQIWTQSNRFHVNPPTIEWMEQVFLKFHTIL